MVRVDTLALLACNNEVLPDVKAKKTELVIDLQTAVHSWPEARPLLYMSLIHGFILLPFF